MLCNFGDLTYQMGGVSVLMTAFILFVVGLFFALYLRPLTDDEIYDVAMQHRRRAAKKHLSFSPVGMVVSAAAKKDMPAGGGYWWPSIEMSVFPSYVAALLKGKKHEWIVAGFAKADGKIHSMWMEKGFDRHGVSLSLSIPCIIERAKKFDCQTILLLHNHPNSNPSQVTCLLPSEMDKKTALTYGHELGAAGLNLVEFVCERGRWVTYHREVADSFMPVEDFLKPLANAYPKTYSLANPFSHFGRIAGYVFS
jgi:hypothetical protein